MVAAGCGIVSGQRRPDSVGASHTPDAAARLGCTAEEIAVPDATIVSAFEVKGGELDWLCMGDNDPRLVEAWDSLAAIASAKDLRAVDLLAGYESESGNILALSGPIYSDNQRFVIAVLLDAVDENPDELRLTMVHELAHVLSQTPDQIDTQIDPDDCLTFDNGFGCYRAQSYVAAWVEQFWDGGLLDELPGDGEVDIDGGEQRCRSDGSFVDSYAASHPDEDFAESFAAYVLDVPVGDQAAPRLGFFDSYPELRAMRTRARAAGVSGRSELFDDCGSDL